MARHRIWSTRVAILTAIVIAGGGALARSAGEIPRDLVLMQEQVITLHGLLDEIRTDPAIDADMQSLFNILVAEIQLIESRVADIDPALLPEGLPEEDPVLADLPSVEPTPPPVPVLDVPSPAASEPPSRSNPVAASPAPRASEEARGHAAPTAVASSPEVVPVPPTPTAVVRVAEVPAPAVPAPLVPAPVLREVPVAAAVPVPPRVPEGSAVPAAAALAREGAPSDDPTVEDVEPMASDPLVASLPGPVDPLLAPPVAVDPFALPPGAVIDPVTGAVILPTESGALEPTPGTPAAGVPAAAAPAAAVPPLAVPPLPAAVPAHVPVPGPAVSPSAGTPAVAPPAVLPAPAVRRVPATSNPGATIPTPAQTTAPEKSGTTK